jgi:hypothetical protein
MAPETIFPTAFEKSVKPLQTLVLGPMGLSGIGRRSSQMKDRALARLQQPDSTICRYRAADSLLAFLKTLRL